MLITSKDNPNIKLYIKLRDHKKARNDNNMFVLEGARIIADAVKENVKIECAFITDEASVKYPEAVSLLLQAVGDKLNFIPQDIASKLSDTKGSQGVFAIASRLDKTLDIDKINNGGKFLILNCVQDPGNVGTILRVADAVGIDGVFLCGNSCDIYNPKIVRSTMGSLFRLPVCDDLSYSETIGCLKERKISTYASVIDTDAHSVRGFDFPADCAVVIGNEGNGLTHEEALMCDERITIKMSGNINSLNAAMAAGIILWEMTK
ncbi:MAG: RNA methyltransferase [Oscillospiraceae bacterium]|nr:RNA methyltransferase [Oscillospiraceae bacterium]